MAEKRKRKWGDRKDGYLVRDLTGLNTLMPYVMPNRADAEVCLMDQLDLTTLLQYIAKKNEEHPNYKTTIFHCFVFALAKMLNERPKMNRFIQGRRHYQREEISMSFMAKRRFKDGAEESFMYIIPKDEDTLDSLSHRIYGDVMEVRKSEHATGGVDQMLDVLKKIPRCILMPMCWFLRTLDFWGKNFTAVTRGDSNYSSVLLSNLGSIKCPSVYHHLNNYGTNSFVITIGTVHKEEVLCPDGTKQIRDMVDFAATLDERLADGFYFARSLKLVKYLFAHPEVMEQQFSVPTGFDYENAVDV